ncbi:MAG TPA: PRC-barrel domain-containing protein [Burkholderiaceae bacterium]|nr:PRC-barrel domain-containing protein [Burkholderiaceae bacterium]
MLHDINELRGFSVEATDGPIGHVRDFYFDDREWAIRFLVVDTGPWLKDRRVLVSPLSIGNPDWAARRLPISLSRALVRASPDVDTSKPVSRQHEIEQFTYYGYPFYWGGPGVWRDSRPEGALRGIGGAARDSAFVDAQRELHRERGDDPHLRACDVVMNYRVHAADGDIGHVDGLLIDDQSWVIRYLVVNTSDWWLGHDVLVAPQWIDDISWLEATVSIALSRRAVKDAPPWDRAAPPDREHERRLYRHHDRPGYWRPSERSAADSMPA